MITKQRIQGFFVGAAAILAIPFLAWADRVSVPLVSNLFPSNLIYVNMAPPLVSLPAATTTGSVTAGGTLYFLVTALDGQGETTNGNLVGTTTVTQNIGFKLTWATSTGATGYRVYFSTSTPLAFTQYFAATSTGSTPNTFYWFTSTSSPIFIPGGQPTSNTAYGDVFNSTGNSYILGGSVGIATSSPVTSLDVASGTLRVYSISTSTCATVNDGAIFYNAKDKHLYLCQSAAWVLIK